MTLPAFRELLSPAQEKGSNLDKGRCGVCRRVAFVGTGYIADWHAKALACIRDVRLVAVCDAVLPRARAFAERFAVPKTYSSLTAMLAEEQLDAVHVLLPAHLHFPAARETLNAGVHVFVEKPMCIQSGECQELERLARVRNVRLGVGHNFLFADPYQRLRDDLHRGLLGPIDQISITWSRDLPQLTQGPFDLWMLRDEGNIMLEIGCHPVAQLLDLLGRPDEIQVRAANSITLPTGQIFHRNWQVSATIGQTVADLRFSFVPGFAEYNIRVRGKLGSAIADLEGNTYVLQRHHALIDDFDRYSMTIEQARTMRRQARRTLSNYVLSKLHLPSPGNPYQASIVGELLSFYADRATALDQRISGQTAAQVIGTCERIRDHVRPKKVALEAVAPGHVPVRKAAPTILLLGGSGFIGQALLRKLLREGLRVRLLVRNPGKLRASLRTAKIECQVGDLGSDSDLQRAIHGIEVVYHLSRSNAKTWAEWKRDEIEVTRRIAALSLATGIKRLIYTGTIDSYYVGDRAAIITEETPLDPQIQRRNLYARAKAASETILDQMHLQHGLPLVILRPGIVIGRGGSPFHWGVGRWWHGSLCQLWGDGLNKLPFVLVDDVANALFSALNAPGIEGRSFNLVGEPCLNAQEYLDELNKAGGGMQIQGISYPIWKFYVADLFKSLIKTLLHDTDGRLPSRRDWESRTQRASFDCTCARESLGWRPVADRNEFIRQGIREPLNEAFGTYLEDKPLNVPSLNDCGIRPIESNGG